MKKVYTFMALAAFAYAMPGVAAEKQQKLNSSNLELSGANEMVQAIETVSSIETRAAKKALSAVSEVYGEYQMSGGTWALNNSASPYPSLLIEASDLGGNNVTISSFPFAGADPLTATVDLAAGTITIAGNQDAWLNPNYPDEYVKFMTNTNGNPQDPIVGTISADGTIQFDHCLMMWGISQGYFLGWGANTTSETNPTTPILWSPIRPWQYNAADWTDYGTATFEDHLVNLGLKPEYQVSSCEVNVKKDASGKDIFLVMNPYKASAWQELEINATPDIDGYFYIDATNPDCVMLRPLVGCGFSDADENNVVAQWYPYNTEGYDYYIDGVPADEQIEVVMSFMDPDTESLADYFSSYDKETGKIHIFNMYFGLTGNLLGSYWFGDENPMSLDFTLQGGAAVEDIDVDNANAPVEYYNLQGVKVLNPEAGTLVIKKQGSKVSKLIVK